MTSNRRSIAEDEHESNRNVRLRRANSDEGLRRSASLPQVSRRNSARFDRYRSVNGGAPKRETFLKSRKNSRRCDDEYIYSRRSAVEEGFWKRIGRFFRRDIRMRVEGLGSDGLSASALYANELLPSHQSYAATRPIFGKPDKSWTNVVCQGDPFEIRVVGMQVAQFDQLLPAITGNELVMFSREKRSSHAHYSIPYIHFDYERDANKESHLPDTYINIPDSKTYVAGYKGDKRNKTCEFHRRASNCDSGKNSKKKKKFVDVKLTIVEIDKPGWPVRQAISGIDDMNGFLSGYSSAVPFIGMMGTSLSLAKLISNRAIEHLSGPDPVMGVDVCFQLADRNRVNEGSAVPGKYLRYGYYFFLSEPVSAKLYASVTTSEHVRLMIRREPEKNPSRKGCKKKKENAADDQCFLPLTGVSYIVVRVSEPTGASDGRHRYMQFEDAAKLEFIFKGARVGEDPDSIRRKLINLGNGMGVFDSDSESESGCAECNNPQACGCHLQCGTSNCHKLFRCSQKTCYGSQTSNSMRNCVDHDRNPIRTSKKYNVKNKQTQSTFQVKKDQDTEETSFGEVVLTSKTCRGSPNLSINSGRIGTVSVSNSHNSVVEVNGESQDCKLHANEKHSNAYEEAPQSKSSIRRGNPTQWKGNGETASFDNEIDLTNNRRVFEGGANDKRFFDSDLLDNEMYQSSETHSSSFNTHAIQGSGSDSSRHYQSSSACQNSTKSAYSTSQSAHSGYLRMPKSNRSNALLGTESEYNCTGLPFKNNVDQEYSVSQGSHSSRSPLQYGDGGVRRKRRNAYK